MGLSFPPKIDKRCLLCEAEAFVPVLRRSDVPVLLNRTYDDPQSARRAPVGQLDIACCQNCSFVTNLAFDPSLITYDPKYENDQTHSPAFGLHLSAMAQRVLNAVQGKSEIGIVEVGCGQ